jgi:hypothetical protein
MVNGSLFYQCYQKLYWVYGYYIKEKISKLAICKKKIPNPNIFYVIAGF